MLNNTLKDVILFLMQGIIFIGGKVSILLSVCELSKLLFGSICHVIYVAWTKVVIVNVLVTHPYVTMFLGWLQIRPCICPLENSDHIISN